MLCSCTVIGRLGHDPELKYLKDGKAVLNFSVATQEHKDAETVWFRVTAWEKTAEFIANHGPGKGGRICVQGPIRLNEWEDEDGNTRTDLCLTARQVTLIDWAETADEEEDETPARKPVAKKGKVRR